MGLLLLKEAFEAVQAVPIPSESASPDNDAKLLDTLTQIVVRSERQVDDLRNQLARPLEDVPRAIEDYLSSGGNVDELVADLEKLRNEVSLRHEKIVTLSNQAHGVVAQSNTSGLDFIFGNADLFLNHAKRMNALLE